MANLPVNEERNRASRLIGVVVVGYLLVVAAFVLAAYFTVPLSNSALIRLSVASMTVAVVGMLCIVSLRGRQTCDGEDATKPR